MAKSLVLGLGKSGLGAARLLFKQGWEVCAFDDQLASSDEKPTQELCALLDQGLLLHRSKKEIDWSTVKQVIPSPGISKGHPLYRQAQTLQLPLIGEMELACRQSASPILAITGTNGKTTVAMMVAHVLNRSYCPALAVGNIGQPFSDVCHEKGKYFVAEVSSYQLETMSTKSFQAACLLNISPDHLDRYSSYEEYASTKFSIRKRLQKDGKFFAFAHTCQQWSHLFEGKEGKLSSTSHESIANFLPIRYRGIGGYEGENLSAAFALCREFGISQEQFDQAIVSFEKAPHRLERLRTIRGVTFYNDSKATNVDAVIRAVQALQEPIVLIVGGADKGLSYRDWLPVFRSRVKLICAIGETAFKMRQELSGQHAFKGFKDLEEATHFAYLQAKPGEIVLLSPGCSSFDMFKDYAQRGDEFKRVVETLK